MRLPLLSSLAVAAACLALPATALAQSADVRVTLTGVEARGGHMLATLSSQQTFMVAHGEYTAKTEVNEAGEVYLVFTDVAPGTYALMVMHDANDNEQFDMSPSGMPAEGFAFSSGGPPIMGIPSFDALKFTVGSEDIVMTEAMTYF